MSTSTAANRFLREAILLAAEAVGSNGRGKDGLMGYLINAARTEPKSFLTLLGRIIPLQVAGQSDEPEVIYRTIEQLQAVLAEKGLPVPSLLLEYTPEPIDYSAEEHGEAVKVSNGNGADTSI
jgi:hypothetical protein